MCALQKQYIIHLLIKHGEHGITTGHTHLTVQSQNPASAHRQISGVTIMCREAKLSPSTFSLRQFSIWPNRSGVFYSHLIKQSPNSVNFRFFKPIILYSFSKLKLMFPLLNLRPKIPPLLYFYIIPFSLVPKCRTSALLILNTTTP